LVVDDEPDLCLLAQEFLTLSGYRTEIAANGVKALEKLSQSEYDLIISDVVMPEMDGFKLSLQAKALYPNIKIILLSGYNDEIGNGNNSPELQKHTLTKPYAIDDLLKHIRCYLDEK